MSNIFGPESCGSPNREWLVADGLGGFAAGTVPGLRTRRAHGLLTFAGSSALAALDLTVTLPSGAKVPLYAHEWASGVTDPSGHRYLETFALVDGVPRWRWRIGDVVVEREVAMRHGHPSVAVTHRVVTAPGPVGLALAAMCTWRDLHGERRAGDGPLRVEPVAGGVVVEGAYRVHGPGWQPGGEWHLGAFTRHDGSTEDLWHAGTYFDRVSPGDVMEISAWAGDLAEVPPPASSVVRAARARARELVAAAKADGPAETLVLAADAFIVRAADGPDVVAGYPGSGRRSTDTAIAYEGLFLDTGRADEGRELLRASAPAEFESALWLVHAVDRHVRRTGDSDLAAELADPLTARLGEHAGDDLVTIPGIGKPVSLNALWVNALAALADLRAETGGDDAELRTRHARAQESFRRRFPAPEGWLYDVIDGPATPYPLGAGSHQNDPSLRPHQLLAWSLPHAPMRGAGGEAALRRIGAALLTPLGLRTLAPAEYGFQGDAPEHGGVQPWLIGPYADACAALDVPSDGLFDGLRAHLGEWGTGSVSASADGDPPHRATGLPFSARSVAELLRVISRYEP
ncbi:glycogen debranching enzyme N-terminal domain-containing protein [Paractinoplanes lichenicola]|uniref:Glycogen debranching enzyme family protein n=1 Tax=Paractinoplanes lichenicola TaxID=2802976 RepID=A0ABS1VLR9_9ACTN|nr:glycogen debranching enzyme N-terminal domain-containing protein [Actinoplanes lichenicola]MBL7254431.1 glycogen debranching enzyme family protein [Actinoplanes lichenicola]